MRRRLTDGVVEAAILGGTILGGGGGGHIEDGQGVARPAVHFGEPELWSIDELDAADHVAIVAAVGAPGAPDQHLLPVHHMRALEQLQALIRTQAGPPVRALATNENGALGTVNGWLQAAMTGLPILDAPCNGRAHPTALMGALGLHRESDFLAMAGFAGGATGNYVEGGVCGRLDKVSQIVRDASVSAGGLVAVARNPVASAVLAEHGAPGGISQAIRVGEALLDRGVQGVVSELGGQIVAQGPVSEVALRQQNGFDVGRVRIGSVEATLVNEYMTVTDGGRRIAAFPDLVMTFSVGDEQPVVSADLVEGMELIMITVPRSNLLLSSTMSMAELMQPVDELLNDAGAA